MLLALLFALAQASPEAAALFRSGQRHEAVERMAAELDARPDDRALRRSLVECELTLKAYGSALEHVADFEGEFRPLRARALFFLARYEEALEHLDATDPAEVLLVVDALEALGRMQEVDTAIDAAEQTLGRDHSAARVLLGRRALRNEAWGEAVEHFRRALEQDPIDAGARFGLGRALLRAGKREEGLAVLAEHRRLLPLLDELEFLERSLDLEPRHAPNHAALGDVERRLGRLDRADVAYRNAMALVMEAGGPDVVPVALRYARFLHEDRDQGERALTALEDALVIYVDVRLLVRAGDIAQAIGNTASARSAYERALVLRPGDAAIERRLREASAEGKDD